MTTLKRASQSIPHGASIHETRPQRLAAVQFEVMNDLQEDAEAQATVGAIYAAMLAAYA